jgi:hypothetical protein
MAKILLLCDPTSGFAFIRKAHRKEAVERDRGYIFIIRLKVTGNSKGRKARQEVQEQKGGMTFNGKSFPFGIFAKSMIADLGGIGAMGLNLGMISGIVWPYEKPSKIIPNPGFPEKDLSEKGDPSRSSSGSGSSGMAMAGQIRTRKAGSQSAEGNPLYRTRAGISCGRPQERAG